MKKLIVSIKSSNASLNDFKKALKEARKGQLKRVHNELSFDSKNDFDHFVKNLGVLSTILVHQPRSVYQLAKLVEMDVSNLNKLVSFFEAVGALKIKAAKIDGRMVKTPVVDYDRIEFNLRAEG